jgi:urease accessory protein
MQRHDQNASIPCSQPEPTRVSGSAPTRWRGELALRVAPGAGRSVLAGVRHRGPLRVQRAFHPEASGTCHVYLLHPPGGLVGGDELEIDVDVQSGARALLTTPAAQKVYRAPERASAQRVRLAVRDAASLEWLPQETIAFDGAQGRLAIRVELEGAASFLGWEVLCLGRPGAGERFQRGRIEQSFEVWRAGRPLWIERLRLGGGSAFLDAAWGAAGRTALGTFVCVGERPDLVEQIRAAVHARDGEWFEITQLRDVIVARFAGARAERARDCFISAWKVLRPAVLGAACELPRIWST